MTHTSQVHQVENQTESHNHLQVGDAAMRGYSIDSRNEPVYAISNGTAKYNEPYNSYDISITIPNDKDNALTPNTCKADLRDDDLVHEKESLCRRIFCVRNGPSNIHLLVAEFLGTGLLLFLGCMGCITNYETMPVPHYMPAVSFGLTVMIIIQMFGHISGAHLNPSVTMITALNGMIEKKSVPFYLLGQFAGAIFGLGGLKWLMPEDYIAQEFFDESKNMTVRKLGLCTTDINSNITPTQGLIIEIVITFVLIFVCCAIWDKRNADKQDSVPLRFGFVISAIAIAAGPMSGGSMNTARSFAPALLNSDWDNQWIYWVGPNLGALIAYYCYKFVYELPKSDPEDELEGVALKTIESNNEKV